MAHDTDRRRRVAAVLATLSLIGVGGIASTALFTTEVEVRTVIETGSFRLAINGSDGDRHTLRLSTHELNPGTTATAQVSLQNTGTVDSLVHLAAKSQGDKLTESLEATVHGPDGKVLYEGRFAELELAPIYLVGGTAGMAGQRVDLTIELTAPATLGNDFQTLEEKLVIDVYATQAEGA